MDLLKLEPMAAYRLIESQMMESIGEGRTMHTGFRFKIHIKPSTPEANLGAELETWKRQESTKPQLFAEPSSALFAETVRVDYRTTKAKMGYEIAQTHTIKPTSFARPIFELFCKLGYPLGASGGIYSTRPANKKSGKIEKMLKMMKATDIYAMFKTREWREISRECYMVFIDERIKRSRANIEICKSGIDVFAHQNPESGTGIRYQGRKLKRLHLDELIRKDSYLADKLLEYQLVVMCILAAGYVHHISFIYQCLDPLFEGGQGARSDASIESVRMENGDPVYEVLATTRQIDMDTTGALTSKIESSQGGSTSIAVIKMMIARESNILDPTRLENIAQAVATKPEMIANDEEDCLVPLDFGIVGRDVSLGADMINGSWMAQRQGERINTYLKSGSVITSFSYLPIQIWIARTLPFAKILAIGDDVNIIVKKNRVPEVMKLLHPYNKRKSEFSNGKICGHKILGRLTAFTSKNDVISMITPRGLKTVTSALGGFPVRELSGTIQIDSQPDALEAAQQVVEMYPDFMLWQGTFDSYRNKMDQMFSQLDPTIIEMAGQGWMRALEGSVLEAEASIVASEEDTDEEEAGDLDSME